MSNAVRTVAEVPMMNTKWALRAAIPIADARTKGLPLHNAVDVPQGSVILRVVPPQTLIGKLTAVHLNLMFRLEPHKPAKVFWTSTKIESPFELFPEKSFRARLAGAKSFRPSQLVVIVLARPRERHLKAVSTAAAQQLLELESMPILSHADIRAAARQVGHRNSSSRGLFSALVEHLEFQVARDFDAFSAEHLDRLEEMVHSQYMILELDDEVIEDM